MDPIQRFFSPNWIRHYQKVARDFFAHTHVDAEDACQNAQEKLLVRIREKPQQFSEPLVHVAFKNLLREEYRKHFPRIRPPKWIQKLGGIWLEIFELFCRKRLPAPQITDLLRGEAEVDEQPGIIDLAVERIKAEQACGKPEERDVSIDTGRSEDEQPMELPDHVDPAATMGSGEVLLFVRTLLGEAGHDERIDPVASKVAGAWGDLGRAISVTDEESLMLRLVFQKKYSVAKTARILGEEYHNVNRGIKRTLKRIRLAMESAGISMADLSI